MILMLLIKHANQQLTVSQDIPTKKIGKFAQKISLHAYPIAKSLMEVPGVMSVKMVTCLKMVDANKIQQLRLVVM